MRMRVYVCLCAVRCRNSHENADALQSEHEAELNRIRKRLESQLQSVADERDQLQRHVQELTSAVQERKKAQQEENDVLDARARKQERVSLMLSLVLFGQSYVG